MNANVFAKHGLLGLVFVVGCGQVSEPGTTNPGNAKLGIAELVTETTPDMTTIVGYDADGQQVARMELVHGPFTLSGPFVDESPTPDVIGRKLVVDVKGQHLNWQTAGFDPTMSMPAHPPDQWAIAAFLEDAQVKPVLDRWQIGFRPSVQDESPYAYVTDTFYGWDGYMANDVTSMGSVRGLTINTCGSGSAAIVAGRLTQYIPGMTDDYLQYRVTQCCPANAATLPYQWGAFKTCPLNGTVSECGTSTGACKGCATYDSRSECQVDGEPDHTYYVFSVEP